MDRLASVVEDGCLWSDAEARKRGVGGTTIGISGIKERRLTKELSSHPKLRVGDCVPFYFCPRSVMLYVLHRANNPELGYTGGQDSIIHMEADLRQTVNWANLNNQRWSFTSSNAGATYFEDYANLDQLNELDWDAIQALDWRGRQEGKQAEYLLEKSFPWELVARVGIRARKTYDTVHNALRGAKYRPPIEIKPDWYY